MKKILFVAFVLSNLALFSQQGFTTYTYNLTSTINNFKNVSAIELGSGSDVWIGLNSNTTNRTLLKFNGNIWTDFTSLVNFPIQTLKYDGAGNLWIGSSTGGLLKFDGVNYVQYTTSNSGILSNNVLSIDIVGSLTYIGTNAGISVFDGVSFTSYSRINSGLSSDTIYAFEKDVANNIWIGTAKGLNMMNASNVISNIGFNDKVFDVMIDAFGDKWIGTNANGLVRYNGSTFTNSLQVSGNIIGAIMPTQIFSIGKSPAGNPIVVAKSTTTYYQEGFIEVIPSGGQKLMLNRLVSTHNYNKIFASTSNGVIYYVSKTGNTSPYTKSFLHKFDYAQFNPNKDFVNITEDKIKYLDINNVNAACNPGAGIHGDNIHPMYEVPKGSNKFTTLKSNFWIGGYTSNQLHIGAETYRQNGMDFQPGPLDINNMQVDSATIAYYNKVWKVDRLMVENFKYQFQLGNVQNGSYIVPNEIATWPGNPIDFAQPENKLAPYFDYNGDFYYNPMDGDYPYYKDADQILFWVINDRLAHLETGSVNTMGIQVGVTAYAYTCPQINDTDRVLNHTTFYNYHIINKSNDLFDSIRIGIMEDVDLGYYLDDFVGCDVQNNFAYVYNGGVIDEDFGGLNGYNENRPYFSLNVLQGGVANVNDGLDNDRDGCIDCTWYLDPITHVPNTSFSPIDDDVLPEYNRMSGFLSYNNTGDAKTGNPTASGNGLQYYRYLNSLWKDGSPMRYDPSSVGTSTVVSNPICTYLYPGTSDPNGFGVGGSVQNPIPLPNWAEYATGFNAPGDRNFLVNSGKSTLYPNGGFLDFDYALVFTQDSLALVNGLLYDKVVSDNKKVYNWWKFNEAPSCLDISGVGLKEYKGNIKVNLFPNPATTQLTIDAGYENEIKEIKVLDVLGKEISKQTISSKNKIQIDLENYNSGVYLIQVKCANGEFFGKFIKH